MEFDLQSLFGLHVHRCSHWLRPRNPPLPSTFVLMYEGAIGQPRQTTSVCDPLGTVPCTLLQWNVLENVTHTLLFYFYTANPVTLWVFRIRKLPVFTQHILTHAGEERKDSEFPLLILAIPSTKKHSDLLW